MSIEFPPSFRRRIAIVGGGISGMAAAYLLAAENDVVLFESEWRLGGHARTVLAGKTGGRAVDTGFIVFNYSNYPYLTSMFRELDVPVERSDMSFGVTVDDGRIEYGLHTLSALLAQKRNLARPGFARMVRDIFRFNALAEEYADSDDATIDDVIAELRLGRWFKDFYLRPICGAIWSTGANRIGSFPAGTLVRFFRNHALLGASGQHQWWTVSGGSREYVNRLSRHLRSQGARLRVGEPVRKVLRHPNRVTVVGKRGSQDFDHIVLACHSDQALALLEKPTAEEQAALSGIRFQSNDIFLHWDSSQMPRRRACWSSWVYQARTLQKRSKIGVTYWMNRLQNIPLSDPLYVTLNPVAPIPDQLIYDHCVFRHPVYDRASLAARKILAGLQGRRRTWFAGAYLRNGFHEDGFASAVRIKRALTDHASIRRKVA